MIFDDLKNITFYKGIHPNLDKAIDYLYQHRKDSFELGKYEIDGDKVFLVVLSQLCDFLARRTTPAKWLCRYGREGSQISL